MKRNSSKPKRRYGDAGFTLVELVVVIAVLAILAGVGAVAYSGYIDYANKGVDRQTVGEVIRAIEMAGYSETVPEGTGFVPVVLSNGDKGPVIATSDPTIKGIIENALKDAYGDLSSIKLAYDGWEGSFSKGTFQKIKDGANVKAYWEAIKNSDGSIKDLTSYSGHVDEIWDIVSNMVEALDKGNLAVDGITYEGGKSTDYLTKMVTQTQESTNTSKIIDAWTNGSQFTDVTGTGAYLGAKLARNYAFYQFVQEKYSDEIAADKDMKTALENIKINGKDYTLALAGIKDKEGNPVWTDIMDDYKTSGRAAIDAKAYLSLMEAVGSVKAEGVELKDSDYLKEATKLIGGVEPALAGDSSMLEMLSGNAIDDAGPSKITIYVTIENGMMKVKPGQNGVAPEDADPRDKSDSNVPSEPVAYTENGATFSKSEDVGVIVMKPNSSITITINSIPKVNESKCRWEGASFTGNVTNASSNQAAKTVTITAGAAGSGTVTVSWVNTIGGNETPVSFTLNVSIK